MKISKCASKLIGKIIIGALLIVPLFAEPAYALAADSTKIEQGVNEKQAALQEASIRYLCAAASFAAYSGDVGNVAAIPLENMGYDRQVVVNKNRRAQTKFYILENIKLSNGKKYHLVAIPGTEKSKDIEVDLRYGSVYFGGDTPKSFQENANIPTDDVKDLDTTPVIHRGFNDYVQTAFFTSDEDSGKMGIDSILPLYDDEDAEVYLTGHSLGGAAAIILAARLNAMGIPAEKLHVLTFGGPAVGNQKFAELCKDKFDLERITIKNDIIVTALPKLLGSSRYVQFGNETKWKRSETIKNFQHSIAVYLDCAIKKYYDAVAAVPGLEKKSSIRLSNKGSIWNGDDRDGQGYKAFIAPIDMRLADDIQKDATYMKLVVEDILLDLFKGNIVSTDEIQDLKDTCKTAADLGCEYVIFIRINGNLDKESVMKYQMELEENIYDVSGKMLFTQTYLTNSLEVTPIEAVMYNMLRGNDMRQQCIQDNLNLQLGSIFSK